MSDELLDRAVLEYDRIVRANGAVAAVVEDRDGEVLFEIASIVVELEHGAEFTPEDWRRISAAAAAYRDRLRNEQQEVR